MCETGRERQRAPQLYGEAVQSLVSTEFCRRAAVQALLLEFDPLRSLPAGVRQFATLQTLRLEHNQLTS